MSATPPIRLIEANDPLEVPRRVALVRPDLRPAVRKREERYVMTFPHLIVREVILFQLVVIALALLALLFNAPLEEVANPLETPNPAKAPWYFLGLQELLHYFPPIVAGVVLPGLVVVALVVIPYARINLTAGPLWEGKGRGFAAGLGLAILAVAGLFGAFRCWPIVAPTLLVAALMFAARGGANGGPRWRALYRVTLPEWIMSWFVVIGSILTIIGTFFRGPGWSLVWPWTASMTEVPCRSDGCSLSSSVLFLIVLAISPAKNALRPYRALQRRYAELGRSRARSLKAAEAYAGRPVAIRQIWLPGFDGRVDRCITCHLGVDDALMEGAPEPFTLHPRTAHTPGSFDRFGCTACHGGQGLATFEADAHGDGKGRGPPHDADAPSWRPDAAAATRASPCPRRRSCPWTSTDGEIQLLRLPRGSGPRLVPRRRAASDDAPSQDRWRVGTPLAQGPQGHGSQRPHAQRGARRSRDRGPHPLSSRRSGGAGAGLAYRLRWAGAGGGRRQRQEALLGVPLHLVPHRRGERQRLGPRAVQGRVRREPGLAAGLPAGSGGLRSAHADAALPLQRDGVPRRRGVHGGRVPGLRRAEGHPGAAARQPDPRGDRRQAVSQVRVLRVPRAEPEPGGEVRARPRRNRRQAGGVPGLRPASRPAPDAACVAGGEAGSASVLRARAEDAVLRVRRGGQGGHRHGAPLPGSAARARELPSSVRLFRGHGARRARGSPHRSISLLELPPDREPGRRHLHRAADGRREQGQERLARELSGALLLAAAHPRGAHAHLPDAQGRGDAAGRRDRDPLRRLLDTGGPLRGPAGSRGRRGGGAEALRHPGVPCLSHPRIRRRLLRASPRRHGNASEARLGLQVAEGPTALAVRRALPRLRPHGHRRSAARGLPRPPEDHHRRREVPIEIAMAPDRFVLRLGFLSQGAPRGSAAGALVEPLLRGSPRPGDVPPLLPHVPRRQRGR